MAVWTFPERIRKSHTLVRPSSSAGSPRGIRRDQDCFLSIFIGVWKRFAFNWKNNLWLLLHSSWKFANPDSCQLWTNGASFSDTKHGNMKHIYEVALRSSSWFNSRLMKEKLPRYFVARLHIAHFAADEMIIVLKLPPSEAHGIPSALSIAYSACSTSE